jgi:hypothetical protein
MERFVRKRPFYVFPVLILFLSAILAVSCNNPVLKSWYPEPIAGSGCDITVYYFINPSGVGSIGQEGGSKETPAIITINYPHGMSVPASDADIKIMHTGAAIEVSDKWENTDEGFIRLYTVSAETGAKKYYRVIATEGESTGTSSSGLISAFMFTQTNGLLEGHINTQSGAIAGVFSDPETGVYPFTYNLENNTDSFEIAVEEDTTVLKIKTPIEARSPWIVRVKVTDSAGSFYAGPVQFTVNPPGTVRPITSDFKFTRAPGGLWVHSLGGEIAGTFGPPADGSGTAPFSYELAGGDGSNDADNGSFDIVNKGSALSINPNATLQAEANPYNILVKITDSLGATRLQAFQFNIGVARVVITNHPSGSHAYNVKLFPGNLSAADFTNPPSAHINEGEATARSTIADMIIHGTVKPEEGEDKTYSLLLYNEKDGYVGYFNGITFIDGIATVLWPEVWHTFTDADKLSAFMASPDSLSNGGSPYRISLADIDMKTQLSEGGSHELYSSLRSDFNYVFDFRGCQGDTFTSKAGHPNADRIKEVYLGENLQTVGEYAFEGCVNLVTAELPPAVKTIGNYAFRNCQLLPNVTFPKTIESIGEYAFSNCYKISGVDLSSSALESIGQYAFYSSDYNYHPMQITAMDLSGCQSLVSVGKGAFQHCTIMETLSFASCSALKTIGENAFYYSHNLETIDFSGCVELETISGGAFNNSYSNYSRNGKLKNLDFQDCVKLKTIGGSAFAGCGSLESVDLTNTVIEKIEGGAFYRCGSLASVDLSKIKTTLKTIGGNAFAYCGSLSTVDLSSCKVLELIDGGAFYGCGSFTEDVNLNNLKNTLKSIGGSAFQYCGITSITLTGSTVFKSIGDYAFANTSGLVTANFTGCTGLESIGGVAFASSGIVTADFTGCTGLKSIGGSAFSGSGKIESVDLSGCNALTSIGGSAFASSAVITVNLTGCSSLDAIAESTFNSCSRLTTVTLTGCIIKTIGRYAFYNCVQLTTFSFTSIKTTLVTINEYAFSKSALISANLSECAVLTSIAEYAFDYCEKLTSANLPASLESVGNHAFEHCGTLAYIRSYITKTLGNIFPGDSGDYTFSGIAANFTLRVPTGRISTYRNFWSSKSNWQQPSNIED